MDKDTKLEIEKLKFEKDKLDMIRFVDCIHNYALKKVSEIIRYHEWHAWSLDGYPHFEFDTCLCTRTLKMHQEFVSIERFLQMIHYFMQLLPKKFTKTALLCNCEFHTFLNTLREHYVGRKVQF